MNLGNQATTLVCVSFNWDKKRLLMAIRNGEGQAKDSSLLAEIVAAD